MENDFKVYLGLYISHNQCMIDKDNYSEINTVFISSFYFYTAIRYTPFHNGGLGSH